MHYALDSSEWVSEGGIHDMDSKIARLGHHEKRVKAILNAPPKKRKERDEEQKKLLVSAMDFERL
jgi:hypothetical protein